MKKWMIAVTAIVIVAVGVGAFFGGRASVASGSGQTAAQGAGLGQAPGNGTTRPSFPGGAGGFPGNRGGNLVSGKIIAVDDTGITVQTNDGGSKIVLVAPSTAILKTEQASRQDLTVGEEVVVTGSANQDGSVTAARIQLGAGLLGVGRSSSGETSGGGSTTPPGGAAPSPTTTTAR